MIPGKVSILIGQNESLLVCIMLCRCFLRDTHLCVEPSELCDKNTAEKGRSSKDFIYEVNFVLSQPPKTKNLILFLLNELHDVYFKQLKMNQ